MAAPDASPQSIGTSMTIQNVRRQLIEMQVAALSKLALNKGWSINRARLPALLEQKGIANALREIQPRPEIQPQRNNRLFGFRKWTASWWGGR
jgi:hypothetical protein